MICTDRFSIWRLFRIILLMSIGLEYVNGAAWTWRR